VVAAPEPHGTPEDVNEPVNPWAGIMASLAALLFASPSHYEKRKRQDYKMISGGSTFVSISIVLWTIALCFL